MTIKPYETIKLNDPHSAWEKPEGEQFPSDGGLSAEEIAFIQGAKWWEFVSTGCTMWNSDGKNAAIEAAKRKANKTLGRSRENG